MTRGERKTQSGDTRRTPKNTAKYRQELLACAYQMCNDAEGCLEMANHDQEPVVLELAPLPREKSGPFLLLGVEKDADKELIEASWARRVIGARKNQISVP